MKRIKIDEVVSGFDGKPLVESTKNEGKEFTIKGALLNILGGMSCDNAEEAIRFRELGILIQEATDFFVFRDSDESLIKKALDKNTSRYNAIVIGQVALAMKNAEAFKGEDK